MPQVQKTNHEIVSIMSLPHLFLTDQAPKKKQNQNLVHPLYWRKTTLLQKTCHSRHRRLCIRGRMIIWAALGARAWMAPGVPECSSSLVHTPSPSVNRTFDGCDIIHFYLVTHKHWDLTLCLPDTLKPHKTHIDSLQSALVGLVMEPGCSSSNNGNVQWGHSSWFS